VRLLGLGLGAREIYGRYRGDVLGRYRGDIGAAAARLLRLGLGARDAVVRLLLGC